MVTVSVDPIIGGGSGYPHTVSRSQATKVVESRSALLSAMKNASSSDVVFIPGDASIDLTGVSSAPIGADGVTLASDRGQGGSKGGRITADDLASANTSGVFKTSKSNVRVTGIRWEGPRPEWFDPGGDHHSYAAEALHISEGGDNWEIDNNHFDGWAGQAINQWGDQLQLHSNRFTRCQEEGLGYGIEIQKGMQYITCNYFNECRHDIASTGRPSTGYVARNNVCGITNNSYGHSLDVHGYPNGGDVAGKTCILENNTVMRRPPRSGAGRREKDGGVHVRGVPSDKCVVRNNWFKHPDKPNGVGGRYEAYWQSNVGSSFRNMSASSNHYGTSSQPPSGVGAASGSKTFSFPD